MGNLFESLRSAPVEQGQGWSIHEVDLARGSRQVIVFDRATLRREIANARAYQATNPGKLPANDFWRAALAVREDDVRLFNLTHQCRGLQGLLRGAELDNQPNTPGSGPIVTPSLDPLVDPIIDPGTDPDPPYTGTHTTPTGDPDGGPHTSAVPEPASVFLMSFGLIVGAIALRRRRSGTPVARSSRTCASDRCEER